MKKAFLWAGIVLVVGAGAFLLLGSRRKAEPKYRTAKIERGSITQTVAATGTLSAVTTVKVGSVVSGNVAALHADFNKKVKKGDLLAELDPAPFQDKRRPGARGPREGAGRPSQLRDRAAAPEGALEREARRPGGPRPGAGQLRLGGRRRQPGEGVARAGRDGPAQQPDHRADRRRRRRPPVRRRPAGRGVLHRPDDLHDRAGPHEDAGLGRRLGVRHRHVQGRPAGPLHRRRVSRADLPRNDRADPAERDRQPERRDLPGDHRGQQPRSRPAAEHDRQRVDRRRHRAATCCASRTPPCASSPEESAASPAPTPAAGGASVEERAARGAGTGPAGAARAVRPLGRARRRKAATAGADRLHARSPAETGARSQSRSAAGITDGRFTQVVSGELKEGETVVVGLATAKADATAARPWRPWAARAAPGDSERGEPTSSGSRTSSGSTRWARSRCGRSTA